jgi:hypothetical protein
MMQEAKKEYGTSRETEKRESSSIKSKRLNIEKITRFENYFEFDTFDSVAFLRSSKVSSEFFYDLNEGVGLSELESQIGLHMQRDLSEASDLRLAATSDSQFQMYSKFTKLIEQIKTIIRKNDVFARAKMSFEYQEIDFMVRMAKVADLDFDNDVKMKRGNERLALLRIGEKERSNKVLDRFIVHPKLRAFIDNC